MREGGSKGGKEGGRERGEGGREGERRRESSVSDLPWIMLKGCTYLRASTGVTSLETATMLLNCQ